MLDSAGSELSHGTLFSVGQHLLCVMTRCARVAHQHRRCDSTRKQTENLVGLPLDPQRKRNVMHNCRCDTTTPVGLASRGALQGAAQRHVYVSCYSTTPGANGRASSHVRSHRCVRARRVPERAGPVPTQPWRHASVPQTLQRGCRDICQPVMRSSELRVWTMLR